MPLKISKAVIDENLREVVFNALNIANIEGFQQINARQFGCIIQDMNGVERYVRIGAIVAEEREDITARELMQSEIDKYMESQRKKIEKAQERAEKAKKDAEKRAAAAAKAKEGK